MKYKLRLLTIIGICAIMAGCGSAAAPDLKTDDIKVTTTVSADTTGKDGQATTASAESEPYVLKFESVTIDGEKFTSDCFADSKLTMINVWGTYCGPCLSEMPDLGEISAEYDRSEFQIIGVVCDVEDDASKEYVDNVKSLVKKTGADYTHLLLSDSLFNNLVSAAYYVPTSFFFNQKGEYIGYVESAYPKETWVGVIESLLKDME